MDCREFEAELDRRLDERLDPHVPELAGHASNCAACGELLHEAAFLLRGVAVWKQQLPVATRDLADRIVANILPFNAVAADVPPQRVVVRPLREDGRPYATSWHTWVVAAGTVAAVGLVFLGSSFQPANSNGQVAGVDQGDTSGTSHALRPSQSAVVTPLQARPQADLETVLVSAEGAYSQLANKTFEAAQDFALLWPSSQAVSNSGAPSKAQPSSTGEWNQGWQRELTPIGDSVGEAFDFLRRAAPQIPNSAS